MRIYLADTNNGNHRSANHYLTAAGYTHYALFSYYYYDVIDMPKLMRGFDAPPVVFADSGAFSAYTLGKKTINVHAYGDWLLQNQQYFEVYANLDEKRGTAEENVQAGIENQQILEDMGLTPLPVFHAGEPWSVLADMVQDYGYIALGGTAGHTQHGSDTHFRFCAKAFEIAKSTTKFHAFGVTSWDIIKGFPWYSVDSSSWGQSFRYGTLVVFDDRVGKWKRAKPRDHKAMARISTVLNRYGLNWVELLEKNGNRPNRKMLCGAAAISYAKATDYIHTKAQHPQGVTHA